MLRILLEYSGYDVQTATDAQQGLALAAATSFDLILLDLEMPGRNGRDFFEDYRRRDARTPIVIVSAHDAEAASVALGAQGSIAKPFDPADLIRQVQSILEGRR
jgi:DNA-binding response OmpR family regulator